jgi:hypothetical protein
MRIDKLDAVAVKRHFGLRRPSSDLRAGAERDPGKVIVLALCAAVVLWLFLLLYRQ